MFIHMYVIILIQVHRMHPCMYLVIFIESSSPPRKIPSTPLFTCTYTQGHSLRMYIHEHPFIQAPAHGWPGSAEPGLRLRDLGRHHAAAQPLHRWRGPSTPGHKIKVKILNHLKNCKMVKWKINDYILATSWYEKKTYNTLKLSILSSELTYKA